MIRGLWMESSRSQRRRLAGGASGWFAPVFLLMLTAICPCAFAQVPTITGINPNTVTAGSPAFTLTVTGTNYNGTSTVSVNGTALVPSSATATQLLATVPAQLVATAGQLPVQVINRAATGGPLPSNTVTLTVAQPAPAPILISAAPGFPVRGESQVQMTLVGANFRPGATVIVSPPLASLSASTGRTQASDVRVLSVRLVNSGLMTARIDVSPTAAVGLRAIDVLNVDGTSTAVGVGIALGGSSQPLRVQAGSSLGAPVTVVNLSLMHPRNGTVVMRNHELYADAILGGAGSGTVIGEWVWDGNVVEQFSASFVGGTSTTITTRQSLPTSLLGPHRLQLRMVQPNQVASVPITVVVNPGNWQLEQLVLPEYGAAFTSANPPSLLWAPVPGAEKYQVGFTDHPYLSTVSRWFDVVDNRWDMPAEVWEGLPAGPLYWTVRTIDSNGVPRRPLPLRSVNHVADGGLRATHSAPGRTPAGHTLLEWTPGLKNGYYFVTISRDFAGMQIVRQYLTKDANLDLHAVEAKLLAGITYYWQVDAISPTGQLLFSGPVQSFVAQPGPGPQSQLRGPENSMHEKPVLLASVGAPVALPGAFDLSSEIAGQTPAPGSSTNQLQPPISVSFQSPVNPADVSLMVDDVDITTLAQVSESKVSFTPPLALSGGEHTVNLSVGSDATTWKFTVVTPATPAAPAASQTQSGPALVPDTDAEAPPAAAGPGNMPTAVTVATAHQSAAKALAQAKTPAAAKNKAGPTLEGQIGVNTQWVSGANPPDTNVVSLAEHVTYQKGPWHMEANGSGLLNSVLNPQVQRTSKGQVNEYVLQAGYKGESWGTNLRFGIVTPALYTDAQFVTAATPRQGAELTLKSPVGTLGGFVNTNDTALGGGAGINFHQQIQGASYQLPLPKWAELRGMWLNAKDTGAPTTVGYDSMGNPIILPNPVAPVSAGDAMGALLKLHLGKKWLWTSEYAISYENANLSDPTSKREFGRAWRSAVAGQVGKVNASGDYRELNANFGTPTNPSLTQSSQPNVRGVDASISDTTHVGNFGLTYTFLDNNVHSTASAELRMNSYDETWTKSLGVNTNLSVEARQSLTGTGTVPAALQGMPPTQTGAQDLRDIYGSITLSRTFGIVSMNAGGTRDWSRNNYMPSADTITSSINVGATMAGPGFFQLNVQGSVNWVAADGLTIGTSRNYTVNVQPAFIWKHPGLQVSPLITVTKGQTVLTGGTATSDTFTGQYGGQLSWTMPGKMKFSTLTAQGSYNQNHDNIALMDQDTTQLLVLWTLTWGHKHTF
ncbi:MAG TPA: IPT/TIG domain-containing protein [Terracidiphilus sp.]|nr:IPT/TIG domain-containing protein [Terracidiphilus sp.]